MPVSRRPDSFLFRQYLWVLIFRRDIAVRYCPYADSENHPIAALTRASLFLNAPGTQSNRVNLLEHYENLPDWVPCFLIHLPLSRS